MNTFCPGIFISYNKITERYCKTPFFKPLRNFYSIKRTNATNQRKALNA